MFSPTLSTITLEEELAGDGFDRCIAFVIRLFMVKTLTAVRIKERDLKALEELAVQEDETVSSLIRQAIREFLDRRRNDPDKG